MTKYYKRNTHELFQPFLLEKPHESCALLLSTYTYSTEHLISNGIVIAIHSKIFTCWRNAMPSLRSTWLPTLLSAAMALLAACAPMPPKSSSSANSSMSASGAAASDQMIPTSAGTIRVQRMAMLEEPWAIAALPDGKLLITEKPGRLRIYENGRLSEPVSGLPQVAYRGQGGLLDVLPDPNFASNQTIYFSFTEAAPQQPPNTKVNPDPRLGAGADRQDNMLKGVAVARARLQGNALSDVRVIWRQVPKTIGLGHGGAHLLFAADGKLLITSGERQRFEPAQDMNSNLGKLVRINTDGSIPQDNPFVNKPGMRPDVWASGLRNSLGIAINPATNAVWTHDMGAAHGDEVNIIERGKNYGWPVVSNGEYYDQSKIPAHAMRPDFAAPAYYWVPAISPSGLAFYTGNRFANWKGSALIGSLSTQSLVVLSLEGDRVKKEDRVALRKRIRDVMQSPDGYVLVLTDAKDGELLRLSPAGG
jgi:aldose sugar dehydrogenase